MKIGSGKGLSELQRSLLLKAFENVPVIDELRKLARDVYEGRVKTTDRVIKNDVPHLTTLKALKGRPGKIARITVTKTFKTLIRRGLVKRWYPKNSEGGYVWLGIDLTTEGRKVAEEISKGF